MLRQQLNDPELKAKTLKPKASAWNPGPWILNPKPQTVAAMKALQLRHFMVPVEAPGFLHKDTCRTPLLGPLAVSKNASETHFRIGPCYSILSSCQLLSRIRNPIGPSMADLQRKTDLAKASHETSFRRVRLPTLHLQRSKLQMHAGPHHVEPSLSKAGALPVSPSSRSKRESVTITALQKPLQS